mmetsp:Transcript_3631/g.9935  ORF Transcript_3631/g.9935 Transcript_3631/m.9935 type:complete len:269 (-) Transcript_3631:97-903(-)
MSTSRMPTPESMTQAVKKLNKGWDPYPEEEGGKAGQIRYGCGDGVPKDAPYFNRLKSDLANSYYWSGNFVTDYFFFVANWHPVIGMLFCHPNHPWSKAVRTEMFIISLSITLVPSAFIGSQFTDEESWASSLLKTPLIVGFVTIPDIVVGVILYQVVIADTRCPNLCGTCLDATKKCCICWVGAFAILAAVICFFIMEASPAPWTKLLIPLVEGRAWSFLTWFPIWLILPCQLGYLDLWCYERRAASRAEEATSAESERQAPTVLGNV